MTRRIFDVNFNQVSSQIPVDKLVKQYYNELIEVLLSWQIDNFNTSQSPILPQMDQVMHIIHEKTDPAKVSEIKRQFLAESRIHYQQYVFKLKEKVQNLSHERQMLQN